MSDVQASQDLTAARNGTAKRDWRIFTFVLIAGIVAAAAFAGMRYHPEIPQKLIVMTAMGLAFGWVTSMFAPINGRERIGAMAACVAILTFPVANAENILAAWLVCGLAALTSIVVLALYWSEPLPPDPGSIR